MGLTIKNKTSYELGNNLTEFFSLPVEIDNQEESSYSRLKDDIFKLDIDNEEKANIINKINSLSTIKNNSEKKKIITEIENFKKEYDL
jgi:predicted ribosome quality control (RQC) complex YloA/Tae2 family protein